MQDFEALYKAYYPQVYRYIKKLCQDELLAEEITQEAFFKVIQSADKFKGQCKFSVWMCQIAKNTLYSYLKKSSRTVELTQELPQEAESLENLLADKEAALKIHALLHVLAEPYREVFWMRTFGELSFCEIAKLHRKSESWARVTYHRAKMKIREELK